MEGIPTLWIRMVSTGRFTEVTLPDGTLVAGNHNDKLKNKGSTKVTVVHAYLVTV